MSNNSIPIPPGSRIVGFDSHPDTFTASILQGPTPAAAVIQKTFNKVPMDQLTSWVKKHLNPHDIVVLEASGNSFCVVRTLRSLDLQAYVLESCQMGKLKEAHANNDRISAVRIAKAFLAGTAKNVWVPDLQTQENRDVMHAYRKAVKRCTQTINRLDSYLSDNGVRLTTSLRQLSATEALAQMQQAKTWSAQQLIIIQCYQRDIQAALESRGDWEKAIATTVVNNPTMLSLTRLRGIRDIIAFHVMSVVGDIHRFARPKSLVNYFGLSPSFDDSGNDEWSGGVGTGRGRCDVRSLLVEAAQSILNTDTSLGRWGRKLMAKKGSRNLAAAAVARRLVVAIWYLLMGKWEKLEEIDSSLSIKIGKIISKVGTDNLKAMETTRKDLRAQIVERLRTGRTYHLDPERKFIPKAQAQESPKKSQSGRRSTSLAEEYGLT